MTRGASVLIAACLALAAPAPAQEADALPFRGLPEMTLFALPQIAAALARIRQADDPAPARETLARLAGRHPGLGMVHVLRAGLEARAGDRDAALAALAAAAASGQAGLAPALDAPEFAALAGDPAFAALRMRLAVQPPPAPARPALIAGGAAPVSAANTVWAPRRGGLLALFEPMATRPELAVLDPARSGPADRLLRSLYARGLAAGNWGDLYDNRDGGHSRLSAAAFPQLSFVTYAPAARAYAQALPGPLHFDRPTIGNASLAITGGALPRSLARQMMTGGRMGFHAGDIRRNRLTVYPEHTDHDPEGGDRFPANTALTLVSQGSSGSDMALVEALAMTLAAFRPDTKDRLSAEGLVAPTLQMILRRTYGVLPTAEGYYTAAAHPTVFDGDRLNPGRMVGLANALLPGDIPPMARIEVVEDLAALPGETASEALFTTPWAVARIWRSRAWAREMVLSAAATRDPNGRPLSVRWVLLRGDPEKVSIAPSPDGTTARIRIAWHDPYPAPGGGLVTHRIDIAAIASNGVHPSAPAILSVAFPPNQQRTWEDGPRGTRLKRIAYRAPEGGYADPALFARGDWTEVMVYGPDGALAGWTRTGADGTEAFIAAGP